MKYAVKTATAIVKGVSDLLLFATEREKEAAPAWKEPVRGFNKRFHEAANREHFTGKAKSLLVYYPSAFPKIKRVIVAGLGKGGDICAESLRVACGSAAGKLRGVKSNVVHCCLPEIGKEEIDASDLAAACVEGIALGSYQFLRHKSENSDGHSLQSLVVVAGEGDHAKAAQGVEQGRLYAEGTILARDLVNEPASVMTPIKMASIAKDISRKNRIAVKVYDERWMDRMGMGSLRGVSYGSAQPPRFVHMVYRPAKAKKSVAIVGKGITFDSGGLCIKPADGMGSMKDDMGGAAVVLGVFSVIAKLNPRVEVHGIFPATENMPGGKAYKPGDVLKAMNGKTIEVVNTDAEGRLILADALCYASRLKPDAIIDMATLTGACVVALGDAISGIFGTNQKLIDRLIEAGKESGEKLWHMPLEHSYKEMIKSDVADVKNSGGRWAGAITAALFLKEFVDAKIPWTHIDIAGPAFSGKNLSYCAPGATGVMVRTILRYLQSL